MLILLLPPCYSQGCRAGDVGSVCRLFSLPECKHPVQRSQARLSACEADPLQSIRRAIAALHAVSRPGSHGLIDPDRHPETTDQQRYHAVQDVIWFLPLEWSGTLADRAYVGHGIRLVTHWIAWRAGDRTTPLGLARLVLHGGHSLGFGLCER